MRRTLLVLLAGVAVAGISARPALAHDGPPYPIVSDQVSGPYTISVWTDPDTTDDGSPGGQFWVMLARRDGDEPVPPETRATILSHPLDRTGTPQSAATEPVRGNVATQFGAVVFDHEGRFAVQVEVDGPLGRTSVDSEVSATYDLRPAPLLVLLYLMPFVLIGVLWTKLLLRRRAMAAGGAARPGARTDADATTRP